MPFKKRAQLSIELIVLIFAVLLGGALLTSNMLSDSGEYNEISNVKKSTFSAFINSEGTVTSESGNNENTEEEGNEDESEEEEEDTGEEGNEDESEEEEEDTEPEEEEENNLDKIYAKILDINPTSSAKNNEFEATLYGGGTVELQKKGPTKGIYINETFYPLENTQKEINVTKIILRIKGDCVIIINDTIVFDKNDKNFIIECVEGGTCPIPITIGMENGAGTYWLEIDVDDVKVTSESSGSGKN